MVYAIKTLEGNMMITKGDYIIKGLAGEFYPCKPDVFHMKYENEEELKCMQRLEREDELKCINSSL